MYSQIISSLEKSKNNFAMRIMNPACLITWPALLSTQQIYWGLSKFCSKTREMLQYNEKSKLIIVLHNSWHQSHSCILSLFLSSGFSFHCLSDLWIISPPFFFFSFSFLFSDTHWWWGFMWINFLNNFPHICCLPSQCLHSTGGFVYPGYHIIPFRFYWSWNFCLF